MGQNGTEDAERLPLDQLEELRGIAPYYYDWLKHPYDDPWWDWCDLRNKYSRVHAAVLNFSGWYDDNYGPEGATTNFARTAEGAIRYADPRTHLLIGPWVHGVDSTARTKSGERTFGAAAAIDYDEVILRWMDHYLRGADNGVETEKPVRYFLMGETSGAKLTPGRQPRKILPITWSARVPVTVRGGLSSDAPTAKKRPSYLPI